MSESLAFMSASSSLQSRLISRASCGSMTLPSVPGNSPNRSSCRRVRARKFSAPETVMPWVGSAHVSTVVAVINSLHRVCANHTGNCRRSQSESLARPVFHDAHPASQTVRRNCDGQGARRFAETMPTCAQSAFQSPPGSLRYGFVTRASSRAAEECAPASELTALVAFRKCATLVHRRSQIRCVLCARLCIESNSRTGDVNCAEASPVIARGKCTGSARERSCRHRISCAQSAIKTVRKPNDDSLVTAEFLYAHHEPCCGDVSDSIGAPELRRICAASGVQLRARTRAACLPNLRLGEMYAARNCVGRLQKLLPVVGRIGYAHH